MTDFFGFKKQNSVIYLILSQSFFPCLTLVLCGHLIHIFFLVQKFHFLGFSKQSVFLPFFLFVCHSRYINTTVLDIFSESSLITAIRMIRTPRHFLCSFFLKSFFFTHPFFQTFVIVKSELTPDHNIVKFSTTFTRLGLVLLWIHNTLTMLWCNFIFNKRTNDKEISVDVMNLTNFSA